MWRRRGRNWQTAGCLRLLHMSRAHDALDILTTMFAAEASTTSTKAATLSNCAEHALWERLFVDCIRQYSVRCYLPSIQLGGMI